MTSLIIGSQYWQDIKINQITYPIFQYIHIFVKVLAIENGTWKVAQRSNSLK